MPDIKHAIAIDAPPAAIDPLVRTPAGLAAWWAEDVTTGDAAAGVELGFFNRSTVYRLVPQHGDAARWRVETGDEWAGTTIVVRLRPAGQQTQVEFSHEGWRSETPYFTSCNTVWGHLMFRLKDAAERGARRPFFTRGGTQ